jgi:hypothetical protein
MTGQPLCFTGLRFTGLRFTGYFRKKRGRRNQRTGSTGTITVPHTPYK